MRVSMTMVAAVIMWSVTPVILLSQPDSPASKLAFVANLDGNWDLFIANDDGTGLERLTQTPYDEQSPCLSLDGREIAYASSDGYLRIMDLESRAVETLPKADTTTIESQPCFAPTQDKMVYVVFSGEGMDDSDLGIHDRKDDVSRLFFSQVSVQLFPAWSPDGREIAYANVHCSLGCGRIIDELWVVDSNARLARQILLTNSHCLRPSWSPAGDRIAFSSDMAGNFDIYVFDLTTDSLSQVTTHPAGDTNPSWSRNRGRIAFNSTRSGMAEIWITTPVGDSPKVFRPFGNKQVECMDPSW